MVKFPNNLVDISSQIISIDKEYITREGKKVRILCTDNYGASPYSVVAIIDNYDVKSFTKNGYYNFLAACPYDLIEIPKQSLTKS